MSELKTCFKKVDYDLSGLLHYIDIGDIALPDIQRPFVWSNAKVRDLFDSMYRGFPVGYFLFWENVTGAGRHIGTDAKQRAVARLLIVDGQQRLTSLFAVFRGRKVLDENYTTRHIEVAFRPRDGKFEVADAAIRRDPEWIPNISNLWASGQSSYQMVKSFLKQLVVAKGALSDKDEELISHNLDRLFDLQKYPFTALEIAASVDEEQVADIFVRINSEGVRLNQADFILTLMSVFWDEGRMALEAFCRASRQPPSLDAPASPFNHFIHPDPDQMLRVAVAFAFGRARLKSVYQVLRGKDMETGDFSAERRDQQFRLLKDAQDEALNLMHWHQFLSCLVGAGFRSGEMLSSQTALLYAYAFYLIGRKRFSMPEHQLQRLIGRWFFAVNLTGRYTNSPETVMDSDLNRLKGLKDAADFAATLEGIMATELTNDFWMLTLPANLDSSSARNPELFAYMAAQNRLGAPVLFSHKKVSDLLDPTIRSTKKALERHHLFPRAWLERNGEEDLKRINQVANFALLEWPDNIDISDDAPTAYVPQVRARFSGDEWTRMHEAHALPAEWHLMDYDAFLIERRKLMAAIIRRGFESIQPMAVVAVEASTSSVRTIIPSPSVATFSSPAIEAVAIKESESEEEDDDDENDHEEASGSGAELTPSRRRRLDYWTALYALLTERKANWLRAQGPGVARWIGFPLGRQGIRLWAELYTRDQSIGVGVSLRPPRAKHFFKLLAAEKDAIERELGFTLDWDERPGRSHSYLSIFENGDAKDRNDWPRQHAWMTEKLERLHAVLSNRVQKLPDPEALAGESAAN